MNEARRLLVFEHRYLRWVAEMRRQFFISNTEVRCKILNPKPKLLEDVLASDTSRLSGGFMAFILRYAREIR